MSLARRPQFSNGFYPRARPFDEFLMGNTFETFDHVVDPNTNPVYMPSVQSGRQAHFYQSSIMGHIYQASTRPIRNTNHPFSTGG
ncbi:unnamed protein product [Adineta ricciae]|uniref:Uncharacterized protein n=1 Tax=Adineta ricciae TaxID=249248 RepID=A0A813VEB5_ADIRI|nr:unnamed protein product [Adineta ricciae]